MKIGSGNNAIVSWNGFCLLGLTYPLKYEVENVLTFFLETFFKVFF
jgi:hypothetical protein